MTTDSKVESTPERLLREFAHGRGGSWTYLAFDIADQEERAAAKWLAHLNAGSPSPVMAVRLEEAKKLLLVRISPDEAVVAHLTRVIGHPSSRFTPETAAPE